MTIIEDERMNIVNVQRMTWGCNYKHQTVYRSLSSQLFIVQGTRWHCTECHSGIDLCEDCAITQSWKLEVENPTHDPSHRLVPIKPPQCIRSYDLDYFPQSFSNSSYNYLDPNFLPE